MKTRVAAALLGLVLFPQASNADVESIDDAVAVAEDHCGHTLNLPPEHHARWQAAKVGDHWTAWLLSDFAPTRDVALLTVEIQPSGVAADCIVHVR
jgi:hypothetical protein